jgi:hypothetical protein
MNLKKLGALAMAMISINAFSYGTAKVISQKFHSSKPGIGGFIDREDLAEKFSQKKTDDDSDLYTHALPGNAWGKVDENTKINSEHTIRIHNTSKQTKRFVIKYDLSCGDDEVSLEEVVIAEPGNYYHKYFQSFANVVRHDPGGYTIVGITSINGDGVSLDLGSSTLVVSR